VYKIIYKIQIIKYYIIIIIIIQYFIFVLISTTSGQLRGQHEYKTATGIRKTHEQRNEKAGI
jgi:hypothetical protein